MTPERLAQILTNSSQKQLCDLDDGIYVNGNVSNPIPELCAEVSRQAVKISELKADKQDLQARVSELLASRAALSIKVEELKKDMENLKLENRQLRKRTSGTAP